MPKECNGVDLQQVVTRVRTYKRPFHSSGGKSGAAMGLFHEAAVTTTDWGELFLIEKGVERNDDINYKVKYRKGECRIVGLQERDIRNWRLVREVKKVEPGTTLKDLFDGCGSGYNWLTDNCWNETLQMRAKANRTEDGLAWQEKAIFGAVAVGGVALLAHALSGDSNKKQGNVSSIGLNGESDTDEDRDDDRHQQERNGWQD